MSGDTAGVDLPAARHPPGEDHHVEAALTTGPGEPDVHHLPLAGARPRGQGGRRRPDR